MILPVVFISSISPAVASLAFLFDSLYSSLRLLHSPFQYFSCSAIDILFAEPPLFHSSIIPIVNRIKRINPNQTLTTIILSFMFCCKYTTFPGKLQENQRKFCRLRLTWYFCKDIIKKMPDMTKVHRDKYSGLLLANQNTII